MIRAVLDTNVIVSAVLSPKGIPAKILTALEREQFHILCSEPILEEIARVLRYPKIAPRHRLSEEELLVFLEDLARLAIFTPGKLKLSVIKDDPDDDRYLECAVEGEAEYIVSGDQHLLNLEEYKGIEIITPRTFLQVLQEQPEP